MVRAAVGKKEVGRFRVVALAVVVLVALYGNASACCCTCENSVKCFPVCFHDATDFASCDGACLDAGCGHIAACPDPGGGGECTAGDVSCLDVTASRAAPAPAMATGGLVVAVLLLGAVGYVMLLRPRR